MTFPSFHITILLRFQKRSKKGKDVSERKKMCFEPIRIKVLSPNPIYSDFLSFRFIPDLLNYLNATVM